jgi:hypothetical protein
MTSTIPKDKEKQEKILFSMKKEFEIIKKEKFNEFLREWYSELEVIVDGQKYTVRDKEFDDILKALSSKIGVLKYINDSAYQKIAEEIMLDFAVIMYKLSWKHRY